MAVLTGKPHARTAQAATDVILWALPAVEFDALAEEHPEIRMALSKTFREPLLAQDQERAVERLSTMTLFDDLSEEVLWAVSERLLLHHVPAGEYVFVKGAPGDALYLIDDGQVEILSEDRTGRVVDARLGTDQFFGEMALLTGKPRTTSARTKSHTNLWVLYRSDFDDLVNRHPAISLALSRVLSERLNAMDRRFADDHLRGLKLLAGLSSSQIDDISRRLKPARFRQGEMIIREGEPGEEMFFIESGRVQVIRGHGPAAHVLDEMGAGELFGEMALLTDSPRSATILALSDLDAWVVSKIDFDDLVTAYPTLAMALSRLLSERLRNAAQRPVTQTVAAAPAPATPATTVAAAAATTAMVATAATVAAPTQPTLAPKPAPQRARQARPAPKTKAPPAKPRRNLGAEVGQAFGGVTSWFGSLSRGAKVRLVLFTMLLAWLFLIVVPVVVIQTLAADDVTNLQGAIAFVQTTTPLPTDAPPATATTVPVVAEAPPAAPATTGPVPVEVPQAQQVSPDQVRVEEVAPAESVSIRTGRGSRPCGFGRSGATCRVGRRTAAGHSNAVDHCHHQHPGSSYRHAHTAHGHTHTTDRGTDCGCRPFRRSQAAAHGHTSRDTTAGAGPRFQVGVHGRGCRTRRGQARPELLAPGRGPLGERSRSRWRSLDLYQRFGRKW